MTRVRLLPVLALAALVVCGCESKPTHESVMKESIDKMKEFASILEGVTDESSAQAAKPKLQAIGAEMKELKAKSEKLGKLPPDEEKRLKAKYEPQVKELMPKLMSQMMRIGMDPKLAPIIRDAMPKDSAGPSNLPGM